MPISALGTDNGINYRIMTFDAPYANVKNTLKSVQYQTEVNIEMDTTYQASLDTQKNKAVLLCDTST
ncbi:hypothetical protein ADP71_14360 [Vitreoscilla sp. C1]|nr:hypothetical protein ADP71_14360 [Vitreoscilla sp. C1]